MLKRQKKHKEKQVSIVEKNHAVYACVKEELDATNQLMKLAQQVSFSQERKALVVSFSPPISAQALAMALRRCES